MKSLILLPFAVLLSSGTHAASYLGESGWRPLFDGHTLKGWTPKIAGKALGKDPLRTFRARNGAIKVSYDRYDLFAKQFGHLAYRLPLRAYKLRLEYRFSGHWLPDIESWQQSNSGIMLFGQPPKTMLRDQHFPVSVEMQLLGAERTWPSPTGNLCTPGTNVVIAGKLETKHCITSSSPVLANNRWIKAAVSVDKVGNVIHFIEGQPVLHYSAVQYDPSDPDAKRLMARMGGELKLSGGYLYLQSEGHPVEFRKIEIKLLK